MHLKNITKIKKYRKDLQYKVSKNKHTTNKEKNNHIHSQIKTLNEHLNNINKILKYKKLNMKEHKTDINITKIQKIKHDGTQNKQEYYQN